MVPRHSHNRGLSWWNEFNALEISDQTDKSTFSPLPQTSLERLSLATTTTPSSTVPLVPETYLYLAYGSNLSSATFRGVRGIRPLSSINVHVPSLALTFDLPGLPYNEPCFANTAPRKFPHSDSPMPTSPSLSFSPPPQQPQYPHGLIGVVYEVTPADYHEIYLSELSSFVYQDILVPCFAIPRDAPTVDPLPHTIPFLVHTLHSPQSPLKRNNHHNDASHDIDSALVPTTRPYPNSTQPSPRYLALLTTGARENRLPLDYQRYLASLFVYSITQRRQSIGRWIVVNIWRRLIVCVLQLGRASADENGQYAAWVFVLLRWVFGALWGWYDWVGRRWCGEGEWTVEGDEEKAADEKKRLMGEYL